MTLRVRIIYYLFLFSALPSASGVDLQEYNCELCILLWDIIERENISQNLYTIKAKHWSNLRFSCDVLAALGLVEKLVPSHWLFSTNIMPVLHNIV